MKENDECYKHSAFMLFLRQQVVSSGKIFLQFAILHDFFCGPINMPYFNLIWKQHFLNTKNYHYSS